VSTPKYTTRAAVIVAAINFEIGSGATRNVRTGQLVELKTKIGAWKP